MPSPAGRSPGWPERDTPPTSPKGYHTPSRGRAARARLPVASRAAPGPARGRAAPVRRDAARAPVRFGGANPERTTCEHLSHDETHEQEDAGQPARNGTRHHHSASPCPRSGRSALAVKAQLVGCPACDTQTMSAVTDTVQVITGIASLAVSSWRCRGAGCIAGPRLERKRGLPARTIGRGAQPPLRPTFTPGYPPAPPPSGGAPPFRFPVPPPQSWQGPAVAVPESNLRFSQGIPYALLARSVYGALGSVVLPGSVGWMIAGLVLLAIAIAVFVRSRRAPARADSLVVGTLVGMSIASVVSALFPGSPQDALVGLAVIAPVAVIWIVVDRVRHRRSD